MKRNALAARLETWPEAALTLGLLAVAAVLIGVALVPRQHILKTAVLAWVVLP